MHFDGVKCCLPYASCEIGFLTIPEMSAPRQQSPAMPVLEKQDHQRLESGIIPARKEMSQHVVVLLPVPDTLRILGFLQVEVSVHCVSNNVHEL